MSKSGPKYGGWMEQRPEARDHSSEVEMWVEGVPDKGWAGIKFKGLRRLEIETARCAYLESYSLAA